MCQTEICIQFYRRAPDPVLLGLCGGRILPWRPVSPVEMVQAKRDRTQDGHFVLRQHHLECLWLTHCVRDTEQYAGRARSRGMAVAYLSIPDHLARSLTIGRWLFYIEGALTIFIAFCAIFILPDFPTTTRWLSPLERQLALRRMEEDAGVGDQQETEEGHGHGFWLAISDWKVWWLAFALTSQVVALSFNAYFPTLSATMGFNPTVTLLLCAPPFVFAAIVAFILSR